MSHWKFIERLHEATAGRRVALVHDWLNGMRGGEKVFEQLCFLFPRADVFTLFYEPKRVSPTIRAMRVNESRWARQFPLTRRHYRKLLPLLPRMVADFPTAKYDLVISTSHCVAKGTPPPRRGVNLGYVFTPMRYVWDRFEDYLGGGAMQDAALWMARRPLQRWDRRSSEEIDSMVADSRYIAGKIHRDWGRVAGVIYPPVELEFFTPGPREEGDDYFLVVSALVPYKRVDRAIEAARIAGKRLVVIGDGPERRRLQEQAGRHIEFRGWVKSDALREAYRRCQALLYPGVEDFGITALEAQACGRPVLALREGGARETIIEGISGDFFDDPTAESLAGMLTNFNPMRYTISEIRAQAECFSPEQFRGEVAKWVLAEGSRRCW